MVLILQLGAFPKISLAELYARVPEAATGRLVGGRFLITDAPMSPQWLMAQLGGVVKVAELIDENPSVELLATIVTKHVPETAKIVFGVSRVDGAGEKTAGFKIKRVVREVTGRPVRLVSSRSAEFSSATTVLEHLLPPRGVEITFIRDGKTTLAARTVAAQPFDEWSRRDFDRPGRNARRGMLPPKLARMMVNMALGARDATSATIYDPFCGSGAVVSESLLLGVKRVIGSDIAYAAVSDTKKMVSWLKKDATIFAHDAAKPCTTIKPHSVDCVVTEPFLGRPLKKGEKLKNEEKLELETLYHRSLLALLPLLKPDGCVLLAIPYFPQEKIDLSLENILCQTPFTIDPLLLDQQTVRYSRPDQRVGRLIVKLRASGVF